uniref:Uncharacterized protein n=1 Tax=viral metagenome TaxID=1070528 RepID=A0A6M3JPU0_9ZZZZ
MIAEKITITITAEVLSIDSIQALLLKVYAALENEIIEGNLRAEDGDTVSWCTVKANASF